VFLSRKYKGKFHGSEESKQTKGRRGRARERERKERKKKRKKAPCMASHLLAIFKGKD
jgi:hypothetical protein